MLNTVTTNTNMHKSNYKSTNRFSEHGYEVLDIFPSEDLSLFINAFKSLLCMQCKKLNLPISNDLYKDVKSLNKTSSIALNEVLTMARNTCFGHLLASNQKLLEVSAALLGSSKDLLIISGPSFFVNIPSSDERKYTWHSEQNWYPKRRKFLNVWCPIIEDRISDNSMAVMSGSHQKDWFYFSEYTGYDGNFDTTANIQYEIPSTFLSKYTQEIPQVQVGQALFFDGKLVHRSLDNKSNTPVFTIVFRVFDYSNDLTLSSNWADIPYNRKSLGWPEISVEP